jgi:YD repeat-containing protein
MAAARSAPGGLRSPRLAVSARVTGLCALVATMVACMFPAAALSSSAVGERELTQLRTRAAQTFKLPDGRMVTRVSSEPVNWWDAGAKRWRQIDTRLRESAARGVLGRSTNRFEVSVPEDAAGAARVRHGQRWVSFQPLDVRGAGRIAGDEARYRVSSEAQLTYRSTSTGLKEFVRLDRPGTLAALRYRLDVSDGMTVAWRHGGGLGVYDERGALRFELPAPAMFDASGVQGPVRYELSTASGSRILTVRPDRRWLTSSERRFPVTIDPDIVWLDQGLRVDGAGLDCTRKQATPTTSSCGLPTLEAGLHSSGETAAIMRFDLAGVVPAGATVSSAHLGLYATGRDGSGPTQLAATTVGVSWTPAVTWDTRNGTTSWVGSPMGASRSQTLNAVNSWYRWDITETVARWNAQLNDNFGVQVASWGPGHRFSFGSSEGAASQRPYLEILYKPGVGTKPEFTFVPIEKNAHHAVAVNVANGNMKLDAFDGTLHGVERGFARTYNSLGASFYEGKHGAGWTNDFGDVGSVDTDSLGLTSVYTLPGGTRVASWGNRNGCRRTLDPQWFEICPAENGPAYDVRAFENSTESWLSYHDNEEQGYALREDDDLAVTFGSDSVRDPYEETQNTFTSDGSGRYTQLTLPGEGTVAFEYTNARLTRVVRADAAQLTYEYGDAAGNLTAVESSLGRVTFTYGPNGRVASVHKGADTWTFAYAAGATTVTSPGGSSTTYSYAANGQVHDPDSSGPEIDFGLDAAGLDGETADEAGDGLYVDGTGTATLAARVRDTRSGIERVSLVYNGATIATSDAPVCVAEGQTCSSFVRVEDLTFSDAALAEGAHTYTLEAEDHDGNVATLPVRVFVDRSAPDVPSPAEVTRFTAATGETIIGWEQTDDVALPAGVPGSGTEVVRARYQRADSTWTAWSDITDGQLTLAGFAQGANALVQLQAIDAVGNAGAVRSDSVLIAPRTLAGSQNISGTGTASLRVSLASDSDTWVPGEPLTRVPVVIRSGGEEIASKTDANGEAVFPGLPPGDYEIDTDGPGTRVVTLSHGVQTNVALTDSIALLATQAPVANPLEAWCKTQDSRLPVRGNLCQNWLEDASIAIRTVNHLYNVKVVLGNTNNPRDVRQGNDNTKANAFMHAFWNALAIHSINRSFLVNDEAYWADRQAYAFDILYEKPQRERGEFGERRASSMDVWNNGIGRKLARDQMIEPNDNDMEIWEVCDMVRRQATRVQRAKWSGKRSTKLANRPRMDPVYRSRDGRLADGTKAEARMKRKDEFESGQPCRPSEPFRVARAANRY